MQEAKPRICRAPLAALIGVSALFLGACATTPRETAAVVAPAPVAAPRETPAPVPVPVAVIVEQTATVVDPLSDRDGPLSRRSLFFDFDRYDIKAEYEPVIDAHAAFLAANRGRRVVIEGNTDDRGSREYNLALGQARADAVKLRMTLLGAPDAQIETVSFGKEKPRCEQDSEQCWQQNRRSDLDYGAAKDARGTSYEGPVKVIFEEIPAS
jgi:peptidoglycan-associated lipoprotein